MTSDCPVVSSSGGKACASVMVGRLNQETSLFWQTPPGLKVIMYISISSKAVPSECCCWNVPSKIWIARWLGMGIPCSLSLDVFGTYGDKIFADREQMSSLVILCLRWATRVHLDDLELNSETLTIMQCHTAPVNWPIVLNWERVILPEKWQLLFMPFMLLTLAGFF